MSFLRQLDVDYESSAKFWDKSEDERYEYFKNTCFQYLMFIKTVESSSADPDMKENASMIFANISMLIIYLMTTDEERENEVDIKWMNKLQEESDNFVFVNSHQTADA